MLITHCPLLIEQTISTVNVDNAFSIFESLYLDGLGRGIVQEFNVMYRNWHAFSHIGMISI